MQDIKIASNTYLLSNISGLLKTKLKKGVFHGPDETYFEMKAFLTQIPTLSENVTFSIQHTQSTLHLWHNVQQCTIIS